VKVARGKGRAGYERGFEEFFSWNVKHDGPHLLPDEGEFAVRVDVEIERLLNLPGVRDARERSVGRAVENMRQNRRELGLDQIFEDGMRKYPFING
jgi:hypothetical protein